MKKIKALVPVIFLLFAVGCASGGHRKPTIFVDQYSNVPADIPSQFADRYRRFITGKERKEFEKLLTDEERQVFIDDFWAKRDLDPETPENEYKQKIDERIEDITNERFFGVSNASGLLFRSNGGFHGDMAHVYLLHGEPDTMDIIEGNMFVPLMLWVYLNPENGRLLYAFMFYQKGGSGEFLLFYQDSYKMDQCGAIYEVATVRSYNYAGGGGQNCPEDLYGVYDELVRSSSKGGILDGNFFAWALFNFSSDPGLRLDKAIDPPKPASEIAKQSKSRVVGEAPKLVGVAGTDYILAFCEQCNSMIPAELSINGKLTVSAPWKNFDWTVKGEYLEVSLKHRVVLYGSGLEKPMVIEGISTTGIKRKLVEENPDTTVTVNLLEPSIVASFPNSTYRISVYIKSTLTPKYNTWSIDITK